MGEHKFKPGDIVTPIESRWRGHDVITAGVPYTVRGVDERGNPILCFDSPHLRIGWDGDNFTAFDDTPSLDIKDPAALRELVEAAKGAVAALRQLSMEGVDVIDFDTDLVADYLAAAIAKVQL
jgi:hypothetical protein